MTPLSPTTREIPPVNARRPRSLLLTRFRKLTGRTEPEQRGKGMNTQQHRNRRLACGAVLSTIAGKTQNWQNQGFETCYWHLFRREPQQSVAKLQCDSSLRPAAG
jgi:hypothetical protein